MRLAEACGVFDVDALLLAMTPDQFDEWCAKDAIEPIGQAGVTALLATIGAIIASWSTSEGNEVKPEEVRRASVVDGQNWRPIELEEKEASPEAAVALMSTALGGR